MSENKQWILVWDNSNRYDNKWAGSGEILRIYVENQLDGKVEFSSIFGKVDIKEDGQHVAIMELVEEMTIDRIRYIRLKKEQEAKMTIDKIRYIRLKKEQEAKEKLIEQENKNVRKD